MAPSTPSLSPSGYSGGGGVKKRWDVDADAEMNYGKDGMTLSLELPGDSSKRVGDIVTVNLPTAEPNRLDACIGFEPPRKTL